MRLLADECLDGRLVDARDAWRGVSDRAILEGARRERRALVTEDKGFGELVVRRGFSVPGLLLVRYAQSDMRAVLARLLAVVDRHGERLHQMYAVITPARARLRRLDALRAVRP